MILSGQGVFQAWCEFKRIDRDREVWSRKYGHKVSAEQRADTRAYFDNEQVKLLLTDAGIELVAQVCAEVERSYMEGQ